MLIIIALFATMGYRVERLCTIEIYIYILTKLYFNSQHITGNICNHGVLVGYLGTSEDK